MPHLTDVLLNLLMSYIFFSFLDISSWVHWLPDTLLEFLSAVMWSSSALEPFNFVLVIFISTKCSWVIQFFTFHLTNVLSNLLLPYFSLLLDFSSRVHWLPGLLWSRTSDSCNMTTKCSSIIQFFSLSSIYIRQVCFVGGNKSAYSDIRCW